MLLIFFFHRERLQNVCTYLWLFKAPSKMSCSQSIIIIVDSDSLMGFVIFLDFFFFNNVVWKLFRQSHTLPLRNNLMTRTLFIQDVYMFLQANKFIDFEWAKKKKWISKAILQCLIQTSVIILVIILITCLAVVHYNLLQVSFFIVLCECLGISNRTRYSIRWYRLFSLRFQRLREITRISIYQFSDT